MCISIYPSKIQKKIKEIQILDVFFKLGVCLFVYLFIFVYSLLKFNLINFSLRNSKFRYVFLIPCFFFYTFMFTYIFLQNSNFTHIYLLIQVHGRAAQQDDKEYII